VNGCPYCYDCAENIPVTAPPVYDDEIIYVKGWKGKSGLRIREKPSSFIIIEYRKDGERGFVEQKKTLITRTSVEILWDILRCLKQGKRLPPSYVFERIMDYYKINSTAKEFYGTRNFYFKLFYYPIKVLEAKGCVHHDKNGRGVTRLRTGALGWRRR
tara:strand:+ start:22237 stop:22710 length:474 start_codon:yes stop_codon:yes gene_type:complete